MAKYFGIAASDTMLVMLGASVKAGQAWATGMAKNSPPDPSKPPKICYRTERYCTQ